MRFANFKNYFLLASLIIFYFLGNFSWQRVNRVDYIPVQKYGSCNHFAQGIKIFEYIEDAAINRKNIDFTEFIALTRQSAYPPLHSIIAGLFLVACGRNLPFAILLMNTFYLIILIASIYAICSYWGNKKAGIIAAVIMCCYPATWWASRIYRIDVAIMAFIAWGIFCLLKTEYFTDRKWSIIFGLSFGLGMMTKYTYGGFILGPLLSILYTASKRKINKYQLYNILFFLLICLTITLPYYYENRFGIPKIINDWGDETIGPWYHWSNIRNSLLQIPEEMLSPFWFVILFLSVYWLLKIKIKDNAKKILFLWIFIPWLVIFFMPHDKRAHYHFPYIAAMAIVSAFGILALSKKIKFILLSFGIILSLALYLDVSFNSSPIFRSIKLTILGEKISYYRQFCGKEKNEAMYPALVKHKDIFKDSKTLVLCRDIRENSNISQVAWLHNKKVTVIDNLVDLSESMARLNEENRILLVGDDIDEYTQEIYRKAIEDTTFRPFKQNIIKQTLEKMPMEECLTKLNTLLEQFKTEERIYQDDRVAVYLFSKNIGE